MNCNPYLKHILYIKVSHNNISSKLREEDAITEWYWRVTQCSYTHLHNSSIKMKSVNIYIIITFLLLQYFSVFIPIFISAINFKLTVTVSQHTLILSWNTGYCHTYIKVWVLLLGSKLFYLQWESISCIHYFKYTKENI